MQTAPQQTALTQPDKEELARRARAAYIGQKIQGIANDMANSMRRGTPQLVETIQRPDGKPITKRHRPFLSGGELCVFLKGRRKYGQPFTANYHAVDLRLRYIGETKTKAQAWSESWKKVAQRLKASGLWPDMLADVEAALDMGYDKLQKAHDAESRYDSTLSYDQDRAAKTAALSAIDQRLVKNGQPDTSIIWYMARKAKVKKMYFGKYDNEAKLAEIARLMKAGKKCEVHQRVSYDVSFNYDPKLGKAWYSEEYRDCGNGHYYLALDATHALFYEND